jgi:hypothetical protein
VARGGPPTIHLMGFFGTLRDPLYSAAFATLVIIAIAAGAIAAADRTSGATPGDAPVPAATATVRPASTPRPVPTATPAENIWADSQRLLDLANVRDALQTYRARNGAYPSTDGDFSTLCARSLDAGCLLLSVAPDLKAGDGDEPYWYASDGATYTLLAVVSAQPETSGCPADLPAELRGRPVACVSTGGAR